MIQILIRRLSFGLLILLIISALVFMITELLPGDVATAVLGQSATEETIKAFRDELGLDRPALHRYLEWLSGMMRGDLGNSLSSGRPITEMLEERVGNTIMLAFFTAIFAVPLAVGLGLITAIFPHGKFDRTLTVGSLIAISMPEFFTASVLIMIFAVKLRLLPSTAYISGYESYGQLFAKLILPVATLTAVMLAHMQRMTRTSIMNVLNSSYIEMAVLKGVPRWLLVLRHALPNAIAPVVNVIALNLAYLVAGVVVVETVFAYPGLGKLLIDAVSSRDVPLVQIIIMLFCGTYFLLNLLADLISILSNPRRRHPK
jgi:peptide/nickel transport system permease protein